MGADTTQIEIRGYRIFCSICKTHVVVSGTSLKDALGRFRSFGHDDRKVARLRRGPVGWYRDAAELAAEHEQREKAKAAKALAEAAS